MEGKPAEEQVETEDSAPPPLPTRRPPPPPPPQNPGGMKTYPTLEERVNVYLKIVHYCERDRRRFIWKGVFSGWR